MTSATVPDISATEGDEQYPPPRRRPSLLQTLPGMARFLWRSSQGYRLRPWASPYLRWRIETYWGWHADQIDAVKFWQFTWRRRRELWRFLMWAAAMASQQHHRLHP